MSELTDDILSHTDIVDIVSKYVPLKRAGANFSGNCPFHNEKTPSFIVSPVKQIFKCFGCGKGGNVITFMKEIERIDFMDAIKELAKSSNIDIKKYQLNTAKIAEYTDEKEKIKRLHKLAQQFFTDELKKSPEAQKYLTEKRKLDTKTIKNFGVGYAPESHYALLQYLKSKGFNDKDLIQASLAKKGQGQDSYAFFRNRITFPIYDTMKNVVGFSARIINPKDKPKYLNSAEHKAFEKSKILYGLHIAKDNIKTLEKIIVVEGQMDVIALARLDVPVGVATSGTALTDEHIKLIKRYTSQVYLLFDNDKAGQNATLRALKTAYTQDLFPKIIRLPGESKDADDLANLQEGKTIFAKCINEAKDGFESIFQTIKNSLDLNSSTDKQKLLNIMFELIISINNIPMQDHYLHLLAEQFNLAYEVLYPQYKQYAKKEGQFFLRQKQPNKKAKYQTDRNELLIALFHENFIDNYVQNHNLRTPILELAKKLQSITAQKQDPTSQIDFPSLQLRREKELEGESEEKQLSKIKQTISKPLQLRLQQFLKNSTISHEDKQALLKLKKAIE